MNKEIISPYIWAGLPSKVKYKKINFESQCNESIYEMIEQICNILEVPHLQIYQKNRVEYLIDAKRIVVHFLRKYTKLTLNQIASVLQMKDHSSMINLLETCIQYYSNDKSFKEKFNLVQSKLTQEYIIRNFELRVNNKLMYDDNGIIIRD
jgi:hypothetical protein